MRSGDGESSELSYLAKVRLRVGGLSMGDMASHASLKPERLRNSAVANVHRRLHPSKQLARTQAHAHARPQASKRTGVLGPRLITTKMV